MDAGDGRQDAVFNCENASEQYGTLWVWSCRYSLVPRLAFMRALLPLTHRVLPVRMEKVTRREILLLLFTSGEVPQSTSAHHVLVTVLHSAASQTRISLVSKKGKSLTMVFAVSRATSLLRATPAGTPSLPGLFGLCMQPGTLHK